MDGFDLNSSEKADASELQRMIAIEQQKAQFQAQWSHQNRCRMQGEPPQPCLGSCG
uniref:Uncharacterized protein n=1 Tax=Oncorhynchus tshawytscha TaxID=74940 RepID=A0A8C8F8N4_ONCTS